jgi:hypothetical protein
VVTEGGVLLLIAVKFSERCTDATITKAVVQAPRAQPLLTPEQGPLPPKRVVSLACSIRRAYRGIVHVTRRRSLGCRS